MYVAVFHSSIPVLVRESEKGWEWVWLALEDMKSRWGESSVGQGDWVMSYMDSQARKISKSKLWHCMLRVTCLPQHDLQLIPNKKRVALPFGLPAWNDLLRPLVPLKWFVCPPIS